MPPALRWPARKRKFSFSASKRKRFSISSFGSLNVMFISERADFTASGR